MAKKGVFRGIVVSLFGTRMGIVYDVTLRQLFGAVIEDGGRGSMATIKEVIDRKSEFAVQLRSAVAKTEASVLRIERLLAASQQEVQTLESSARKMGSRVVDAQNPMDPALVQLKGIAAQLQAKRTAVPQLQQALTSAIQTRDQNKLRLQNAEVELQKLKTNAQVSQMQASTNEMLAGINKELAELQGAGGDDLLEQAENAIGFNYDATIAQANLEAGSTEQTMQTLELDSSLSEFLPPAS